MVKIKAAWATPRQLDWLVGKALDKDVKIGPGGLLYVGDLNIGIATEFSPSRAWAQGGPIIEREGIDLYCNVATNPEHPDPAWRGSWRACYHSMGRRSEMSYGPTPLIAAMRYFVASKLGEEVDIPEELE